MKKGSKKGSKKATKEKTAKEKTAREKLHEYASRLAKVEVDSGLTRERVLTHIMRIAIKSESTDKLSTALKAMELIGKHLQMFPKQVEVTLGASMINDILNALPEQYAVAVRAVMVPNRGSLSEAESEEGVMYD